MKMKKCISALCAIIAVSSMAVGLQSLNAQAEEANWASNFFMDGASVRAASPTGIRFHTQVNVSEAEKEKYDFGTLIIPVSELDGKTAEEYLVYANANNDDVLNIPTNTWQEGETEYTSVLGGVENGGNITAFPVSQYNAPIVARSYAVNKTDAADVKYTAAQTRTLAQVASIALAATPDPEKPLTEGAKTYLNSVVNTVLGDDNFALTAKTVSDKTPVSITELFSEANGSEGLTAKWSVVEGDSVELTYDENGIVTAFTAVKEGDTKLKAEIGEDSAEVTVSVEDSAPTAVTNVAYDSGNGKITWTASEGVDSYNVTVEKWNDGSKTTYTASTNEYSVELSGVYTLSVSGVSAFGTVGETGTAEYASYTPANASAANIFFDFEDEDALDIVKPSTWKGWDSATSEQAVLSIAQQTGGSNAVKITSQNTAFAGVVIKLPFAIPVANIQSIGMDYYSGSNFNVILSDGTNQTGVKNYSATANTWKNVQLPIADFTKLTSLAPTEITEIYIVKHNSNKDAYFDNISIISYAQKAENEYTLANFATTAYAPYLSVKGSTTYTIEDGYMDIQHAAAWGNGDVRYKLPTALNCDEIQSITFYVKVNDANAQFRFYDNTSTTAFMSFYTSTIGDTNKELVGDWTKITCTLTSEFTGKTLAYIGFSTRTAPNSDIWQIKEVTYTKKA